MSGVKVFWVNVDEFCGGFGDEMSMLEIDVNRLLFVFVGYLFLRGDWLMGLELEIIIKKIWFFVSFFEVKNIVVYFVFWINKKR